MQQENIRRGTAVEVPFTDPVLQEAVKVHGQLPLNLPVDIQELMEEVHLVKGLIL